MIRSKIFSRQPVRLFSMSKVLVALALITCVLVDRSEAGFVGTTLIRIEAMNGSDSGFLEWTIPSSPSNPLVWNLPSPQNIMDGSTVLATVDSLSVIYDGDPQVVLNFAVTAANLVGGTNFNIQSAVVTFSPLVNPEAFATAAITVTDNQINGATVTGQEPGLKAYAAQYNGGTPFAYLVQTPVVAPPGSSNTAMERFPPIPPTTVPIIGVVTSIESEFRFNLSRSDSASGTSNFTVVPEPGTWALLGTGLFALVALARRRRG